jgi:hypothetical protein
MKTTREKDATSMPSAKRLFRLNFPKTLRAVRAHSRCAGTKKKRDPG